MNVASQIIRFKGPANWVAGPGSAGITLLGKIVEADGRLTAAELSLSGVQSLQLPPVLQDLSVAALAAQELVLRSGAREWQRPLPHLAAASGCRRQLLCGHPPAPDAVVAPAAWRVLLVLRQRLRDVGCWRGAAAPISGGVAAEKVKSGRKLAMHRDFGQDGP